MGAEVATVQASFDSPKLNMRVNLLVCPAAFRAVHKAGGIDQFLINSKPTKLPAKARRLRRAIQGYD